MQHKINIAYYNNSEDVHIVCRKRRSVNEREMMGYIPLRCDVLIKAWLLYYAVLLTMSLFACLKCFVAPS